MSRKFIVDIGFILLLLVACTNVSNQQHSTRTLLPTPTPILLGNYALLSPEDMRSDLNELFLKLEMMHPNIYANRSKAEVDIGRQRVDDELDHPMTIIDYYLKVAPLVDSLGDRHTAVYLPPDAISAKDLFLPLDISLLEQRALIVSNYTGNPNIPSNAELLAINGKPISTILNDLTSLQFDQNRFPINLWFLYGSIPEYRVEMLLPGETTPITHTLNGMPASQIIESSNNTLPERLIYRTLPNENIGVLTINTFEGGPGQYLEPAFKQIRQDNVQHLVIDIRSNGGGKYDQVDAVMKYLTDQPYRQCSRRYARYGADITTNPREIECDLVQPSYIPLRFRGDLYLLIGPDTYSAAITFATILQDYDLATLIGEETSDKASYCAFAADPQPLSRTKLLFTCSASCYVRPNGKLDNRGVIPDVIVETTIQDRLVGQDPVLDKALDLIQANEQTPK